MTSKRNIPTRRFIKPTFEFLIEKKRDGGEFTQEEIRYISCGNPGGIIAAPDEPPALLDCTKGRLASLSLEPGSTVLLCTGTADKAVGRF